MNSLFETESLQEIESRIDKLDEKTEPKWGKMNAGQMAYHCQFPLRVALNKEDYKMKPNFILKLLFKKYMYNDKPWRKSLPTLPKFRVTENKNLEKEKNKLLLLIHEFHEKKEQDKWIAHPVFGEFTTEQWGQIQYKHLDHHLTQFGI
ncbi:MAG: DUF1569 domain-containing protein [Bacteroidetes bacterium]|nr:DUF1569 domain-containing protein [Bacteroidota bacterium]